MTKTESEETVVVVEDQDQSQPPESDAGSSDPVVDSDIDSEADAWRTRAEQAEAQMQVLSERLVEVEQATATLSASIHEQAVARAIDTALLRAGVSDLDAAREAVRDAARHTTSGPGEGADPQRIVERLLIERPGLFARHQSVHGPNGYVGGVGTAAAAMGENHSAEQVAREAAQTGDRRLVLRYLRLRRKQR